MTKLIAPFSFLLFTFVLNASFLCAAGSQRLRLIRNVEVGANTSLGTGDLAVDFMGPGSGLLGKRIISGSPNALVSGAVVSRINGGAVSVGGGNSAVTSEYSVANVSFLGGDAASNVTMAQFQGNAGVPTIVTVRMGASEEINPAGSVSQAMAPSQGTVQEYIESGQRILLAASQGNGEVWGGTFDGATLRFQGAISAAADEVAAPAQTNGGGAGEELEQWVRVEHPMRPGLRRTRIGGDLPVHPGTLYEGALTQAQAAVEELGGRDLYFRRALVGFPVHDDFQWEFQFYLKGPGQQQTATLISVRYGSGITGLTDYSVGRKIQVFDDVELDTGERLFPADAVKIREGHLAPEDAYDQAVNTDSRLDMNLSASLEFEGDDPASAVLWYHFFDNNGYEVRVNASSGVQDIRLFQRVLADAEDDGAQAGLGRVIAILGVIIALIFIFHVISVGFLN